MHPTMYLQNGTPRTLTSLTLSLTFAALAFVAPCNYADAGDITGVLVTDSGAPMPRVPLHLSKDTSTEVMDGKTMVSGLTGGDESRAETDQAGAFVFRNVPPGKYWIIRRELGIVANHLGFIRPLAGAELVEQGGKILVVDVPRDGIANIGRVNLVKQR